MEILKFTNITASVGEFLRCGAMNGTLHVPAARWVRLQQPFESVRFLSRHYGSCRSQSLSIFDQIPTLDIAQAAVVIKFSAV